jgi:hypothetical protein
MNPEIKSSTQEQPTGTLEQPRGAKPEQKE